MKKILTILLGLHLILNTMTAQDPLADLIEKNKTSFGDIFENPEQYELQIIYTQIDRDDENEPTFTSYTYNTNDTDYFYPASTIKLPAALLALEKINQLNIIGLNKYSPMHNGIGSAPQTEAAIDTSSKNSYAFIAHYIKKIFLVSDNDAFNRLYEFIGQEDFNEKLWAKGYENLKIIHRIGISGFDKRSNQYTNPVSFFKRGQIIYHQGEVWSKANPEFEHPLRNTVKGVGYQNSEGEIVKGPFDFTNKNYVSLQNLHDMLMAVMFPKHVASEKRFDLTADDYKMLYQYMSQKPRESKHPGYDKPDGYVKFFMFGGDEEKTPDHIRIFNKVGDAYGYLTDVAYVVDLKNNIEFMVSATIHVNDNKIYNDGVYEYNSKGFPFFKKMGQLIYDFELQRPRENPAGLDRFRALTYD